MRQQVSALLMIGKAMSKVKGVNEALATACTLDAIERTTGLPAMLLTKALPSVAPEDTAYGEMKPFHRNGHSGYEMRWKPSVTEVVRKHLDSMEKAA